MTEFSLEGTVATITGASRGIGRAIGLRFAEAGARVVVSSRKLEGVQSVADEIAALGGMDKRAMAVDRAAMDAEIERVLPIVETGRLIPYPDHLIPSDVSWENYQYFVWRWKERLVG